MTDWLSKIPASDGGVPSGRIMKRQRVHMDKLLSPNIKRGSVSETQSPPQIKTYKVRLTPTLTSHKRRKASIGGPPCQPALNKGPWEGSGGKMASQDPRPIEEGSRKRRSWALEKVLLTGRTKTSTHPFTIISTKQ